MSDLRTNVQEAGDIRHENVLSTRDVDAESEKPKLQSTMKALNLRDPKPEAKIIRKAAPTKETVELDICLPFIRTFLVDQTVPHPSGFTPCAHMLYYNLHCLDSLMAQNHHFLQNNANWHPLISRIYYGLLFYIQSLRCMLHVKVLGQDETLLLKRFLEAYPPESLSIAGPLAPTFKALCVSQSRFVHQGKIYPRIPTQDILKTNTTGKSDISMEYDPSYDLLPDMFSLFGCLGSITSEAYANLVDTPHYPRTYSPFNAFRPPGSQEARVPLFNGFNLPSQLSEANPSFKKIFARPGLCYPIETTKDMNQKFTINGRRLEIPEYIQGPYRFDIEEFLNLTDLSWIGNVIAIMTSHSKYFKQPTTLDKCSVDGPESNQVVIHYATPTSERRYPEYFADEKSRIEFSFVGKSTTPDLTDTAQLLAFTSQINCVFPRSYAWLEKFRKVSETENHTGPFWKIRPICMETMRDNGYLQLKDVIQDHFYLDKPKY